MKYWLGHGADSRATDKGTNFMSTPKLLLVEDDIALAELLEYRFENEGYDVRITADGD